MHFYMFNPADFNNSARHLSLPERAIYRDLIDMYYHNEQAIDGSDMDALARRLLCTTPEYRSSLEYVLNEFFVKRGKRHHHHRIDKEIKNYKYKNGHGNVTQGVTDSHTNVTNEVTPCHNDVTQGVTNDNSNEGVTMTDAERKRKSRHEKREMIKDLTNIGVTVDKAIKIADLRELHETHIDAVTEYVTNKTNDEVTNEVTSCHNDVTQGHAKNIAITSNHKPVTINHKLVSERDAHTNTGETIIDVVVDNSTDTDQPGPVTKAEQIRSQRADDIQHWEAPTIDQVRGELFKAGKMIQLTDEQYCFELGAFKAHYAEQALKGNPLTTDSYRKVKLIKWMMREADSQKINQARQEKAKGRFSTDNEDWGGTTATNSSFDSDLPPIYHPSHSTGELAAANAPLFLNGLKRKPLPGMTTDETYALLDSKTGIGESRVAAYDRLLIEMREAV